ncbi:hypothetical protein AB0D74_01645 [Streptomyces sp. NPDC048278]|uniref:DUF7064 domain-containing protein n=1 Tax=Streptomyces sp. NPDC048278 TaxID=3155809 RepID=UPI003420A9CE
MAIDLTGGLPDTREDVFADVPANPEMRDSVSMWISDDRGAIGLPRFAVEAYAPQWEAHGIQLNLALPDGRVYRLRETGKTHPALDEQGRPRIIGAGPLAFRCVEPFRLWTADFRGTAVRLTTAGLLGGHHDGPRAEVEFHIEARPAVPPWIQGALLPDAAEKLTTGVEQGFMGGPRYEQLVRATGTVRVEGEEHAFTGSGLRIRRQGVRQLAGFRGHCWQSALFPDGRAFGYITYPPSPDGRPTYNEGFVFDGDGALVPARVVRAPFLRALRERGEDVTAVLETTDGRTVRVEAETVFSAHDTALRPTMPGFPVLHQSGVRYRWDGSETYGMMERSTVRGAVEWPDGVDARLRDSAPEFSAGDYRPGNTP